MVHPLFRLAAARPQLLAEHVSAYTDLLAEELTSSAALWKRRLALQAIGGLCLAIAAVLAGVAVMLWAALPQGTLPLPWLLVLTPAVPAAVAWWALTMVGTVARGEWLSAFRQQLAADAAMLNGVAES